MTKITINNKDLSAAQTTTCDPDLHRIDTTYTTENEIAGSYDPGIPRITAINSCDCNTAIQPGWQYCAYCGKKI